MDPGREPIGSSRNGRPCRSARRARPAPRRPTVTRGRSRATLAGASLVAVAARRRRGAARPARARTERIGGLDPTAAAVPAVRADRQSRRRPRRRRRVAVADRVADAQPTPTPTPTATPGRSGPCDRGRPRPAGSRAGKVPRATGSPIVELTNSGTVRCTMPDATIRSSSTERAGAGEGAGSPARLELTLQPGDGLRQLVDVANVLRDRPSAAGDVAYDLGGGGRDRGEAAQADRSTVPPCNGPGQPASIQMKPWAR